MKEDKPDKGRTLSVDPNSQWQLGVLHGNLNVSVLSAKVLIYRIKVLPMGSYTRIMDSNNTTYELFGPVNLLWSIRDDKAMTFFLSCLKEFAEFANSKDQENNIPPDKCLKLPYKIENDWVENYSYHNSSLPF